MNRGARRYDTFVDDGDRASFLGLVATSCEDHGVEVIAYCLMGNHFHLVLHCPTGDLSGAVHKFSSKYVRRFNVAHSFDGSLFRDRFKNKLISSEEVLLQTTRYVHRNPLALRVDIRRYRWSSYPAYLGLVRPPRWLRSSVPLDAVGGTERYQSFVETDMATDQTAFAAGVESFAAQPRSTRRRTFFAPIDEAIVRLFQVPKSELRSVARGRKNGARMAAVLVAADRGADSNDIAAHYNVTSSSGVRALVSRARRLVERDSAFGAAVKVAVHESTLPVER